MCVSKRPEGFDSIVMARDIYTRELKTPQDQGLFVNSGQKPAARTLTSCRPGCASILRLLFLPHPDAPQGLTNLRQAGTKAVANVTKIVSSQVQAIKHCYLV